MAKGKGRTQLLWLWLIFYLHEIIFELRHAAAFVIVEGPFDYQGPPTPPHDAWQAE